MAPAYFGCMDYLYGPNPPESVDIVYASYNKVGRVTSAITIACCAIIISVAVGLKFYNQWAEQIILSKTLFVLGFGVCLFYSFGSPLGNCDATLAASTATLIVGDILWTIVLLWVLKNTANRPFQHTSFTKGILFYWFCVAGFCCIYGYLVSYFLTHSHIPTQGYLQYVPICLVSRTFAASDSNGGNSNANVNLIVFIYTPYILIFVLDIFGVLYIRRRFSSSSAHSSKNSARLKVLVTIRNYLGSYAVYTLFLFGVYLTGLHIHSCPDSTWNSTKNVNNSLIFPPNCVSWQGYECDSAYQKSSVLNAFQYLFFSLFCLRGVPDLLVFLYLNKARIVERIRNREYERTARSSIDNQRSEALLGSAGRGVQSLNIAHRLREDIMAYTQVHQTPPSLSVSPFT
jgi:hypothetical protein